MRTSVRTLEMARMEDGQRRPGLLYFILPVSLFLLPALFGGMCDADSSHAHWSYTNETGHGPSQWHKDYPICNDRFQSPVDLRGAVEPGNLTDLLLHGYDKALKNAFLINNGHTVKLTIKSARDKEAWMTGGCLGNHRYYFEQLHFHWGADDSRGSEHTLNGKAYSVEGHFVHRNGKYDSEQATQHPDGLAVLGVFYQISGTGLDQVKGLVKALRDVERAGLNKDVNVGHSLTLRAMLPKNLENFYCYQPGSLTTPPCSQAVTWTVLEDAAPISSDQLGLFRRLPYDNGKAMVDNYRPVQPLNGRTIFFHRSSAAGLPLIGPFHALFLFLLYGRLSTQDIIGG